MAVVNGDTNGTIDEAEPSKRCSHEEVERRIRGESDTRGHSQTDHGHPGDPVTRFPFPPNTWNHNPLSHKPQETNHSTKTTIKTSLRNSSQQVTTKQLKHWQSRSIRSQNTPVTTTTMLPPPVTSYLLQNNTNSSSSSSEHLLEPPNTPDSASATTNTTTPILVSKKGLIGHNCRVSKRYRCSRMRRVKRQEYKKLREMVPALQEKNKVSKVVVIEEAIKYIDELHSALVQRFKSRDIPTTFNGVHLDPKEVHGGNIRELIRRLLANANPNSLPPARIENVRTLPSFLQKLGRHKKS